jgi:hypothetical protein
VHHVNASGGRNMNRRDIGGGGKFHNALRCDALVRGRVGRNRGDAKGENLYVNRRLPASKTNQGYGSEKEYGRHNNAYRAVQQHTT